MNIKRKILETIWRLRYGDDVDIVWPDDLVDMETIGNVKEYHRAHSITDDYYVERLGIKTITREEAESMGGEPCEECFRRVLPR